MKEKKVNSLSRRDTLRLIGAAGATAVLGLSGERLLCPWTSKRSAVATASTALANPQQTCVVKPELTEGPYFIDEKLNRSDIRIDPSTGNISAGLLLVLRFNVRRIDGSNCTLLAGAYVDIWHADAAGNYSDISNGAGQPSTRGQKFLRGYQVTDSNGEVEFQTIYPGWYPGRAVHIHFKIRLFTNSQTTYEFTSQLFFNDSLTDEVYTQSPYSSEGTRDTRNNRDNIYSSGGSQLVLELTEESQGYSATFDIALEGVPQTETPSSDPPEITDASASGKQLTVTGQNFDSTAKLFVNGVKQKKTSISILGSTATLTAKKSARKISQGQTVALQVKNSDGTLSNEYMFTRPVE
jgi:protocatechuate 3,4-dioxygenase beta subunit